MIQNDKQFKALLTRLKENAQKAKRNCAYPGCSQTAIKSHLLQRNGVLKQLSAGQNALFELIHHAFDEKQFKFKLEGISKTLSFPGFCQDHDSRIFKVVETEPFDYTDYSVQLLLSYKAFVNEKRKKEIVVDWYSRIIDSHLVRDYQTEAFFRDLKKSKYQDELGIADGKILQEQFESELLSSHKLGLFRFSTRKLPRVEIAASGVFTFETSSEIFVHTTISGENIPLNYIFLHFIPLHDHSVAIIGCLNYSSPACLKYVLDFLKGTDKQVLKKISDALILQIENLLMSHEFYHTNIKHRQDLVVEYVQRGQTHYHERDGTNIFLF